METRGPLGTRFSGRRLRRRVAPLGERGDNEGGLVADASPLAYVTVR